MRGLVILLSFQLIGLFLEALGLPLPANVSGLILFTAALFLGVVKLEWVEGTARFLLRHMLLFFAPVIVGALASAEILKQEWLAISASLLASLLAGLLVTGWTASLLLGKNPETADDRG